MKTIQIILLFSMANFQANLVNNPDVMANPIFIFIEEEAIKQNRAFYIGFSESDDTDQLGPKSKDVKFKLGKEHKTFVAKIVPEDSLIEKYHQHDLCVGINAGRNDSTGFVYVVVGQKIKQYSFTEKEAKDQGKDIYIGHSQADGTHFHGNSGPKVKEHKSNYVKDNAGRNDSTGYVYVKARQKNKK